VASGLLAEDGPMARCRWQLGTALPNQLQQRWLVTAATDVEQRGEKKMEGETNGGGVARLPAAEEEGGALWPGGKAGRWGLNRRRTQVRWGRLAATPLCSARRRQGRRVVGPGGSEIGEKRWRVGQPREKKNGPSPKEAPKISNKLCI
jgi:hypothetical protein